MKKAVIGAVVGAEAAVVEPLIDRVEVDADEVQIFRLAAELGPQVASDHIPGLVLRFDIGIGDEIFAHVQWRRHQPVPDAFTRWCFALGARIFTLRHLDVAGRQGIVCRTVRDARPVRGRRPQCALPAVRRVIVRLRSLS